MAGTGTEDDGRFLMRRMSVIFLLAMAAPLAAQVAVVNPSVHDATLATERLSAMLLGRVTTWADGSAVVLVLVDDHDADADLLQIAGRPRERLVRGWKRLVFSGTGVMPLEAPNVAAALDLVARTPGAVALLAKAEASPRWRIIPVTVNP